MSASQRRRSALSGSSSRWRVPIFVNRALFYYYLYLEKTSADARTWATNAGRRGGGAVTQLLLLMFFALPTRTVCTVLHASSALHLFALSLRGTKHGWFAASGGAWRHERRWWRGQRNIQKRKTRCSVRISSPCAADALFLLTALHRTAPPLPQATGGGRHRGVVACCWRADRAPRVVLRGAILAAASRNDLARAAGRA